VVEVEMPVLVLLVVLLNMEEVVEEDVQPQMVVRLVEVVQYLVPVAEEVVVV
jgi:hypothetical protein